MNRLQNVLLLAWWLFLLLLALFNWTLLARPEAVNILFMTFELSAGLWMLVLGALLPGLLRALAWAHSRAIERRTGAELTRLKAKAFDDRNGELERFANAVQERVERTLRGDSNNSSLGTKDAPKP